MTQNTNTATTTNRNPIKHRGARKRATSPIGIFAEKYVEDLIANGTPLAAIAAEDAAFEFRKHFLQALLNGEMDAHLQGITPTGEPATMDDGADDEPPVRNKRNGYSRKTLKSEAGDFEIAVPRNRNGTFDPIAVPKYSRVLGRIDDQIIAMYARGMTTRDIEAYVREMHGISLSPDYVSTITDRVLAEYEEWQGRSLESVYPVAFFDAIRIKIRNGGIVKNMAVHIGIGVRCDGTREVLGLWVAENEGASFWASVFSGLKNRGVEDILIAVTDGLKGMTQAIEATFPQTLHQTCIVHLIRNSTAFVSLKDRKAVCDGLKPVYQAVDADAAERALEAFADSAIGEKYPMVAELWRRAWAQVVPFFDFPREIRTLIYTTNSIEGLNRAIRKVVKTRTMFPHENAAKKLVYLAIKNFTKSWKRPSQKWSAAMPQFALRFGERFTNGCN